MGGGAAGEAAARSRLIDRAAMNTREFDRGLWLLLGLCAAVFYVNPFGIGLGASSEAVPVLLAVPVVCAICGYVSAHHVLARLPRPAEPARRARLLLHGRRRRDRPDAPAEHAGDRRPVGGIGAAPRAPASPDGARRAGSLRDALSGRGLIRISGMLLAAMVALVATAGAAGFELPTLRLAVDEATAKRLPVDGRSNLTGGPPRSPTRPARTCTSWSRTSLPLAGPNDGARWELRSSFTKGYNVGDARALHRRAAARRRRRLSRLPGREGSRPLPARRFPRDPHGARRRRAQGLRLGPRQPRAATGTSRPGSRSRCTRVRVECVARRQTARFKRLCAEAIDSLEFR